MKDRRLKIEHEQRHRDREYSVAKRGETSEA